MKPIPTALRLLPAIVLASCSRTPDTAPTQPIMASAASTFNKPAKVNPELPGKMLNQKMEWPGSYDFRCVPAPSHYDSMTKRFEIVSRSSSTLRWETIGRYPEEATVSKFSHVAEFKITPGALGDMQLTRDDSPRPSYRTNEVNFPLSASAISHFTLVSYLNNQVTQEAHFTFDLTLENELGVEKNATYNCTSDNYETEEDSRARRIAEAAQKKRAYQMEALARTQEAGGPCEEIAADMAAAMDAQDDTLFARWQAAAQYKKCWR